MKNKTICIVAVWVLIILAMHNSYAIDLDFSNNKSTVQSFYLVKEQTMDIAEEGLPVISSFSRTPISQSFH